MDYNLYTAEDFASDESFINYYLKTNADDVEFWEQWKSCHPEKYDELINAEHLLNMMHLHLPEQELDKEFQRLEAFIEQDKEGYKKARSHYKNPSAKALYILLLCIGFLPALFIGYKLLVTKNPVAYVEKHNTYGQRSIIQLSDGTRITLNANSTIKYPKVFNEDLRIVELEGEAFFEVMRDVKKPFIVKAEGVSTQVLGTKFNIHTNTLNTRIEIALVEGSVKVKEDASNRNVLLKPNEKVSFSKTGEMIKSTFDPAIITTWKDGILNFNKASFEEVADKLHNSYGITLINNSNKKSWNYTGEFVETDYLTIIKSICFSKSLKYKIVNDTITITN